MINTESYQLLKKEFLIFYRRKSNLLALVLFILLSTIATINGIVVTNLEIETTNTEIKSDKSQITSAIELIKDIETGKAEPGKWYDPRKPQSSILHKKRVLIPTSAELPFLSADEQKLTPPLLKIGMSTRHENPEPFIKNPTGTLYGSFDLIYAVVWILPLFIIVTSYDVLARDRTSGSAPILIMQNASIYKIVSTRLLLRFSLFFIPLLILSFTSLLMINSAITLNSFYYLTAWLVALILFMGIWFSIAGWLNAHITNVTTAGLSLMSIWVVSSLVIPTILSFTVNILEPPINRYQAILDLRAATNDMNNNRSEITSNYYVNRNQNVAELEFDDEYSKYFTSVRYPSMLAFDQIYKPIANEIENRRVQQARWLRVTSFLSPSLAFKLLNDDLAGQSPERRKDFLSNVDEFQEKWRNTFDKKIATLEFLTVHDYKEMPNYEVIAEPFIKRNQRIWIVFCGLLVPFLLLFHFTKRALKNMTA